MIKAVIIGFGGIAQAAHLPGYTELEKQGKIKLTAVCDIDPKRFEGKMEINIGGSAENAGGDIKKYSDWKEMLKAENPDMVDICLPTFLHAEPAAEVLGMGFNVLSEKPMSLSFEDCQKMCEAADKSGKKLMIGQCLRFNSSYNYIKNLVDSGIYGKPLSGTFRRLSGPPIWGWNNWFMNKELSGGALFDLHVHDIDIVRHIFGEPKAVSCVIQDVYSGNDIVHTRFIYDAFTVLAAGDWSRQGMPFIADCTVAFEKATVEIGEGGLTVYPRDGEAFKPEISGENMYKAEIEFFADMLETGCENTVNSPENSAKTIKLVEAMIESAKNGAATVEFKA